MNLRHIEVFLAVARHGSFSSAAAQLHVAQSAVSIAVRRLEESLGARLFDRSSRHVALSAAGQAYLARVQPALAELEWASQEVRELESGASGTVEVAAPAMMTQFVLSPILVDFKRRHPGVVLRLRQAGAVDIARWVASGEVQLGIVAEGDLPPHLATRKLAEFPNVACVPAASPLAGKRRIAWARLLQEPWVAFPAGYHQRKLADAQARRTGTLPRIVLEAESAAVLLEAVRQGLGVTTLPEPAAREAPGIARIRLESDDLLSVAACHRPDYRLPRAAAALMEALADGLAASRRRRRR